MVRVFTANLCLSFLYVYMGQGKQEIPLQKKNLISAPTSHHICNKFNSGCLTDRYGRRNCTFSKESKVAHLRDLRRQRLPTPRTTAAKRIKERHDTLNCVKKLHARRRPRGKGDESCGAGGGVGATHFRWRAGSRDAHRQPIFQNGGEAWSGATAQGAT